MRWRQPHHTWWLAACFGGLALSALAGGLGPAVVAVFVMIFLVGAALILLDDAGGGPVPAAGPASVPDGADDADRITVVDTTDAVPYPEDGDVPANDAAVDDEAPSDDTAPTDTEVAGDEGPREADDETSETSPTAPVT